MNIFTTNQYPDIFPALNIAKMQVVTDSTGPGRRFTIWLQGCHRRCPGCINSDFLPFTIEKVIDVNTLFSEILKLSKEDENRKIEGITLTGGEPLLQAKALLQLLKMTREAGLSVLCYTGYDYDELRKELADIPEKDKDNVQWENKTILKEFFQYIDILIDGEYRQELSKGETYCASGNQKVRFLTNRYSKNDVINRSESSFTIGEGGMEFTGILSPETAEKMKKRLRELGVGIMDSKEEPNF